MSLIKNLTRDTTPSLVSGGTVFFGDIKNCNNIEIEGHIEGNVASDVVTIRENGLLKGDVVAKVFNIKGTFEGKVYSEKINISDTAVILGVLEYKFLAVDYGANVNCELKRVASDKAKQEPQKLEPKK
ncbi:MAG: polymer-forming cytoskeletal protein [Rickettsiales bacterium]|jgi:cytoskeletal protein CcmA (bactofilin family)|nr:polymer-forming cytoskeletal protein [Rickettsiales bacterium]